MNIDVEKLVRDYHLYLSLHRINNSHSFDGCGRGFYNGSGNLFFKENSLLLSNFSPQYDINCLFNYL